MDVFLFLAFAFIAVACAINLVVQTHPISSALSLIGVMGSLAVLYLLLGAEFLAAAQLIVYAGAIMVLFVFVIMLLNLKDEELGDKRITAWKGIGLAAVLLAVGVLAWKALGPAFPQGALMQGDRRIDNALLIAGFGGAKAVGRTLYLASILPFEVTSLLLLVAVVAAVVVAKGKI
jgi:NADH-quinone oxidoreductase subunit J